MQVAHSAKAAELYCAAVEWSLDDPIIINSRDDLVSEARWKNLVEPFKHQVTNLLTFCRRLPVTLLADDVGLGKTISAGLIASELMSRKRVKAILIVCPKILTHQWKEELSTKFDIDSVIALGNELVTAKLDSETYAVITTYNTARLHLNSVPEGRFQMLILDEAHKLRNLFGTANAPQVAKVFENLLEKRFFKFVLMLTATPIQNRLWDLYSIIHLLTIAKGHVNPFGSSGQFKRKFIADNELDARKLNPSTKDEFQSIVYSYMSRIRRDDSNLVFPDRKVLLHRVHPTRTELELLKYLGSEIPKFNRLVQIGILKAFTSSPHAVASYCNSMARNQTASPLFAETVNRIVQTVTDFSKLEGLAQLLTSLSKQSPASWRAVVFTTSRETQTSIENYLNSQGFSFALINGRTGDKNIDTLRKFRADPPQVRVIVSTEAGAEGVNLQVANVLINFDLPWNPMVVEQRIGRVQRLGSKHEHVVIYNLVLADTFDEYIVGRLMEKLQMASHAIGDIEALLESSGFGEGEDSGDAVEEQILKLVLAALRGQDFEHATQKAVASVATAKEILSEQEKTINSLLGKMDDLGVMGPKTPNFPPTKRSMSARDFVKSALTALGGSVEIDDSGLGILTLNGRNVKITVEGAQEENTLGYTSYFPGAPAFDRLVQRYSRSALHQVEQEEISDETASTNSLEQWLKNFSGIIVKSENFGYLLRFNGTLALRLKAFVAHDSYETIMEIACEKSLHSVGYSSIPDVKNSINEAHEVGVDIKLLGTVINSNEGISEFCRYYSERGLDELQSVQGDARKQRKLLDEFTPKIEATIVGLKGASTIERRLEVSYKLMGGRVYQSSLILDSTGANIISEPNTALCTVTKTRFPIDCLSKCEISGNLCADELLQTSEFSQQKMLPEYAVTCAASGKIAAKHETELSDVTGLPVHKSLLVASELSGLKAESQNIAKCEFSACAVLKGELLKSEVSGRMLRNDRAARSSISGRIGDKSEFQTCQFSGELFAIGEGEKCDKTGQEVGKGVLKTCEISNNRVMPTELLVCNETGITAHKDFFVVSHVSSLAVLKDHAVVSIDGLYCLTQETEYCTWSNQYWHPVDIGRCSITGSKVHVDYLSGAPPKLDQFVKFIANNEALFGGRDFWSTIESRFKQATNQNKCEMISGLLSPGGKTIACKIIEKRFLGLKKRERSFLFLLETKKLEGEIVSL
jgi:superfamily II DNA or RNA helicase